MIPDSPPFDQPTQEAAVRHQGKRKKYDPEACGKREKRNELSSCTSISISSQLVSARSTLPQSAAGWRFL